MKLKVFLTALILICSWQISFSQKTNKKVNISGVVLDSKNQPVKGAAIFIDDVNTNSVTNDEGFYKVKTNTKANKISILTIFSGATDAIINGRTSIDFILSGESPQPTLKNINDDKETVNDGYSTVKKKDVTTSSVSKIDGQKSKYKSYQNIYDMIRGEASGVRVIGTNIQIQGPTSFSSSDEPLFIVDGVPVDKIDNISPSQVKSIEVLKGSSAAIYGSRGSTGVIVIRLMTGTDYNKK